jgi:hypothetical protein
MKRILIVLIAAAMLVLVGCESADQTADSVVQVGSTVVDESGKVIGTVADETGTVVDGTGREIGKAVEGTGKVLDDTGNEIGRILSGN